MINPDPANKKRGFTLVETIIYIGLFGLLFAGVLGSLFPFFANSERLSGQIAVEGETAFILRKIDYALVAGITKPSDVADTNDIVPNPGATESSLTINDSSQFQFTFDSVNHQVRYSEGGGASLPLNAERVEITGFSVTHSPSGAMPHYLDVTMTARPKGGADVTVGPIRYHLRF